MELSALKPKLGRWLSIRELKGFLAETPEEVCQGIPINRKLLEIASKFVEEKQGWWEHPDWEDYLDRLHKQGFSLSEECQAPIGNILEIFKDYYHNNNFEAIADKRRKPASRKSDSTRKPKAAKKANTHKTA